MRRSATAISLAFAVFASPTAALAGDAQCGASVVQHIFDMADKDQNGALSPEEYESAGLERYGVSFAQTDANGDGETSMAEYLALYQKHHPAPQDDDSV